MKKELIRKIIHIDMDAFYASVETLDNPRLAGLPLVVAGNPDTRSVVCAANYEAREYGIYSGMSSFRASKLYPKLIFIKPRFDRYREISQQMHAIFHRYTNEVEAVALDEAWLDVTENLQSIPSASWIARRIKQDIYNELRLTCSAGVSYNKFLAKVASDEDKPDGFFLITPEQAADFLKKISVKKIPGVGKVTRSRLKELGIETGEDLLKKETSYLNGHFGKFGKSLYRIIRGIDERPVVSCRDRKSIGVETTLRNDLLYSEELISELKKLVNKFKDRSRDESGLTITLKVKFYDFKVITRSYTKTEPFTSIDEMFNIVKSKLNQTCCLDYPNRAVRLIGISLSNLDVNNIKKKEAQLNFFNLI